MNGTCVFCGLPRATCIKITNQKVAKLLASLGR